MTYRFWYALRDNDAPGLGGAGGSGLRTITNDVFEIQKNYRISKFMNFHELSLH